MELIKKAQKLFHYSFSNLPSSISLSARLQILTLISIFPLWVAVIFANIEQRNDKIRETEIKTTILSNFIANETAIFLKNGRQLAMALAANPLFNQNNKKECAELLNKLMQKDGGYLHFIIMDKNGDVICGTNEFKTSMHFSEHQNFLKNLALQNFLLNTNAVRVDYELNSEAKRTFINFSAPIFDNVGNLTEIAVVISDFNFINEITTNFKMGDNEAFIIFNNERTVLERRPEPEKWTGHVLSPDEKLISLINKNSGIDYFLGIDGIERFYSVKKNDDDSPGIYIAVGASKKSIVGDTNLIFQRNIFLTIIFTLIALVIAKWLGRILFYERTVAMQELNNLKTDFISLTSHQLRTPLTSIRWFTELLLLEEAGKINSGQKEFLEEIRTSVNNLIGLINKLLNVSRIRGSRLKVSPKPTNLLELSQNVIKEMEPQIINKTLKLNVHFPKSLPLISIDPLLIQQIILNLMSNAIKYTPKNGSIVFSIKQQTTEIYFSISDTGIGIPRKEQKYIFERFFRGSNANKINTEGVGVGLFLIKNLVETSGGKIGFSSKENKGSVFWFTLPLSGTSKSEGEVTLTYEQQP